MSKLTKAESARINGAKSKGPKTPEGKQRSRLNAIRHGLAAQTVCLSSETRPHFELMVEAYTERFQPADDVEEDLVEQMYASREPPCASKPGSVSLGGLERVPVMRKQLSEPADGMIGDA